MLRLAKRMRRANRGPYKPSESRNPSFGASSNQGNVEEALKTNAGAGIPPESLLELTSTVNSNSEWLEQVLRRPLDTDSLQPSSITKDELSSVESTTKSLYRGLKPWQTRLLVLQAGDIHSPITCQLIEVDVIDGPGLGICETSEIANYEALSYAWGDPAVVCSVTCNGTQLGIALELATALQYLRSSKADRYIWCDAICINQRDLAEKAHQVKNMLRIFEKASLVIAWLGQPCPSSGRLCEALELVNDKNNQTLAQEHDELSLKAVEDLILALKTHLASAWFVRTWVRQEVFASKKLMIQFGPYQLDFEKFLDRVKWLRLGYHSSLSPERQIIMPSTLPVYQRDYQHCGTDRHNFEMKTKLPSYIQYWMDVLRSGSLFKVSNERDRIYGALGLLTSESVKFFSRLPPDPESLAGGFPIDYNKQVSEVYEDVTKFLMNTSKTLEILDVFGDRR
jgi:hypothetical protein